MTPFETLNDQTLQEREALYSSPALAAVAQGQYNIDNYLQFLANAYHHVRHTVPLMMTCCANLSDEQLWLTTPLKKYIDEEIGHEQWILNDIKAAQGDFKAVENGQPNFATELLVSYVRDYVTHKNAIGFFGMVFVLEGTSTSLATSTAELIQNRLHLPDSAFTYLISHGELDLGHMTFFESLVNRLKPDELKHVIHVARRAFHLYSDVITSAFKGSINLAA